jgi:hypothetical protein
LRKILAFPRLPLRLKQRLELVELAVQLLALELRLVV